ncbi:MAG TPA: response regulator [Tepidisphaeraceae bacterium]|nr:response regulator [Tepidisphaeraceae bacterium]
MAESARILLIEDHTATASVMARLLRMSGYDVCVAGDVCSARAAAAAQVFDLALCDIDLPDGDGCDLMRELKADHKLEGIALTGQAMPGDIERALRAGFTSHLLKPVSFECLTAAIEDFVAGFRRRNPQAAPAVGLPE